MDMIMRWLSFKRLRSLIAVVALSLQASAIDLRPAHGALQSGGGMGAVSAGIGWCYGSRQSWETDLFVGLVPRYDSQSAKVSLALKENFVPWHIGLGKGFSLEPLTSSIYLTTLVSSKVWLHSPERYPAGYYVIPTRVRANISLGQRIKWRLPRKSGIVESVSAYYEIGTCDIYVLSAVGNSTIGFRDLLQLCIGVRVTFAR